MKKARIYYARMDEFWRKGEKFAFLEEKQHVGNIEWQELQPDAKHNWLTLGMQDEYEFFLPVGNKKTKEGETVSAIFTNYSRGIETTRDNWVYNFSADELKKNIEVISTTYNEHVFKWHRQQKQNRDVDSFVLNDDRRIKWSSSLKINMVTGVSVDFDSEKTRKVLYRPFTSRFLYFDQTLIHRRGQFPSFFPIAKTELENQVIYIGGYGRKDFSVLVGKSISDLNFYADPQQSFPFYTYNEDGTNRRENITDWALEKFRGQYGDKSISKWDIFHYVYAVLHHPVYRERYAANLKRELPRVPFAPDFRAFAGAGARLAEIHVNYERQPEYPLERIETTGAALDWRVERMKLGKDKRTLQYNDFLTLSGIPAEAFEYRLGNRSALEWVVDQYQVSTDRRSCITNDPNRADDPQYIVRLVGQVVGVSLETRGIVNDLPELGVEEGGTP